MLVTFTTKAYANITMFGNVALTLLKMMGHSGTVPSAILTADVPAALNPVNSSYQCGETPARNRGQGGGRFTVSMTHRALPLIALLTAAAKEKCDVM